MSGLEYGKIKNISTEYIGACRIGDYGKDEDGNLFCYTLTGWTPFDIASYEAKYWKKKYEQLKNENK